MNWYRLDGETLSGPYGYYSRETLDRTHASNPDRLSDAEMRGYGYIPEWREDVDAPLGWQAPVVETRDGAQWVAVYAAGTPEEREAETLRLWRESFSVDAWQGRYVLASMPAISEGPLAAYTGTTVLDQVDQFVAANLTPPERQRYGGTRTWHRNDPMLLSLAALLGLTDPMIDTWFQSAGAIE